jgi:hypothetical protein
LEVRPARNCPTDPKPSDPGAACLQVIQPTSEITLSWDITPTAQADPLLRIGIPVAWSSGDNWQAQIEFEGSSPAVCRKETNNLLRSDEGPIIPVSRTYRRIRRKFCEEWGNLVLDSRHSSFLLTPSVELLPDIRVPYADRGAGIDLQNKWIEVPITVTTSIGLDEDDYAKLTLLGTVISGLLGTGWLWKLIEAWKAKPKNAGST